MVRIFTDTRNYELQAFGVPVNIQWNKFGWSGVEYIRIKLAEFVEGRIPASVEAGTQKLRKYLISVWCYKLL